MKSPQDRNRLQSQLVAMLDQFAQWNRWEELGGVDAATSRFENLVDDTWHCDSAEAIARFVN